jgi:hypothetical protein
MRFGGNSAPDGGTFGMRFHFVPSYCLAGRFCSRTRFAVPEMSHES